MTNAANSGTLAFYRARVVRDVAGVYENEMFRGRPMQMNDVTSWSAQSAAVPSIAAKLQPGTVRKAADRPGLRRGRRPTR
ncbi:hypothetical protein QC281_00005 [Streptomyces sp. DH17]|nr:hypothetical protein [Streptomyces sp. DH17]OSC66758.1 hypothetical protein B5181_16770 [Streptomyces sp. 4F]